MELERIFLVTGANGHLGNTVAKALKAKGEKVRGFVMPKDKSTALVGLDFEVIEGNICDPDSLDLLFQGLQDYELIVIHTAGIVSIATKHDDLVYEVNVNGTRNIINKCLEYKVKRLIYISSVHAIPEKPRGEIIEEISDFNPDIVKGLYAKTKAEATRLVLESVKNGLDAVVVHPSGIIGPNDYGFGNLTQLVLDFIDGRLGVTIKGGYDFVDIRDVTEGILAAVEKGRKGECYILSNQFYTVKEFLDLLAEVSKKKKIKVVLPMWLAVWTAPLSEYWYKLRNKPPLFTVYSLFTLTSNACFSHKKAERELGYTTRDMRDTLRETVAFLRSEHRMRKTKVTG
jgi:dihydroflavonol-4-reductase